MQFILGGIFSISGIWADALVSTYSVFYYFLLAGAY